MNHWKPSNMKLRYISLLLMTNALCFFVATAQETAKKYNRTITVSQFIAEIQDTSKKTVVIQSTNIVADDEVDKRFLYGASYTGRRLNWDSLIASYPLVVVKKPLVLMDVRFGQRTVLPKIHFNNSVHIERLSIYGDLNFRGCTFAEGAYIVNAEGYFFGFYNCVFKRLLNLESLSDEETTVDNCVLEQGFYFYQNDTPLNLRAYRNHFKGEVGLQSIRQGGEVVFMGCLFESNDKKQEVSIGGLGYLDRLSFYQDTFKLPLSLGNLSVKENFSMLKTVMTGNNAFQNLNLPENNTNLRWDLVKNEKFGVQGDTTYFNGKSKIDADHEEEYFALIKVYSQFLRAYKNNGDQESYNACYIEMKDIQTRKAAFNFKTNSSFSNYFEWKLNRFLKIFCDYGTNPVKALLMSAWVIFLFGLLYFIFPSEGMAFNRKTFWTAFKNHKKMRPALKKEAYIGFKQMLNAMALSMNAFVTLGYGDMPVRGIARYLAVFEGLTGWFLLSIFSASLISQILQ